MTQDKWTKADDAALRRAHAQGRTTPQIAMLFPARTKEAVQRRLNKLGLLANRVPGNGRWTPDCDEILRRSFAEGLSDREIAEQYLPEFRPDTIAKKRRDLGLRGAAPGQGAARFDEHESVARRVLARDSDFLLAALKEHHRPSCGELRVPGDGPRRVSVPLPPGLMSSPASLCAEA